MWSAFLKTEELENMGNEAEGGHSVEGSMLSPENMGRLNDPDGSAWIKGLCGDTMEMYLVIEDDKITKALFNTDGCNASRACGSAGAGLAKGKTLKEVLRLSPADILDMWADIPQGNVHCAILAIGTLHKAVADYLLRRQLG
jgi:nitrogen fixation NifU-like protein